MKRDMVIMIIVGLGLMVANASAKVTKVNPGLQQAIDLVQPNAAFVQCEDLGRFSGSGALGYKESRDLLKPSEKARACGACHAYWENPAKEGYTDKKPNPQAISAFCE